jgi:hypothetical protein
MNKNIYHEYGHISGLSNREMDEYLREAITKEIKTIDILKNYNIENNKLNYWSRNDKDQFTFEDITNYKYKNIQENIPYNSFDNKIESKEYHISRIVYFTNHMSEIKDISVFETWGLNKGEGYDIIDGIHRAIAGYYLGVEKINCIVLNV